MPALQPLLYVRIIFCVLALCITAASLADEASEPVPLIYCTDVGNDVDDILALGMIYALQSRGECALRV